MLPYHPKEEMNTVLRKEAPFFSIIIRTYNRSGTIVRALESLLRQSCQDWECIIIDDASSDNTAAVIRPYLSHRIRYERHAHHGSEVTRNLGIAAARGRYISFLDSDDEYQPEHLAIRQSILKDDPKIDLLFSDAAVVGNPFVPDRHVPGRLVPISECAVGGTFFIRRACLQDGDQFEDCYAADSLFLDRFLAKNRRIKKLRSATYVYHRDVADSVCGNRA